ncbi:MAG: serine acetyltransferase [Lachnospiraceae bacterium]|nr:serine acetyltransferase [Lachnospiraceae bacterium]MBQ1640074.1 serine acetyltransferase [Lachnospiraceae bacterium]MBQ1720311.1 serine acetyltransferase [Lachnospiraceae bacterium]MBQ2317919.1 serine acetyltransferase [Lachnospiraceae bacterium]MBQ2467274.1 serine acetyltransferase [Lachnospiraceae bacterium]
MGTQESNEVNKLVDDILADYKKGRDVDKMMAYNMPDQEAVRTITKKLIRMLLPGFYRDKFYKSYSEYGNLIVLIEDVLYNLSKQIGIVLRYQFYTENPEGALDEEKINAQAYCLALTFCNRIPMIREYVNTDLEATFQGDPAAFNKDEIILSYPGILATTINRLAHELFLLNVPLIPRMMTEYAHSKTGIDIHPGATIGKYFFIDHGTGVVIGSTTEIGEHVKVYQGVTLGALSTAAGQALHGVKRHPTIEDNVTIYSGASILGGETVIGHDSVIGSNAFVTKSIQAGTRVTIQNQELVFKDKDGSIIESNDLEQGPWFYII